MNHRLKLVLTLLTLAMPIAAQATCNRYQSDTFTLNMPATVTVPDSLPVGSVITRQAFTGTAPGWTATCFLATRWVNGRYPNNHNQGIYPTEVPGVGVAVRMTLNGGSSAVFTLHNLPQTKVTGPFANFISAEATFYKIGPVTTGTVPAGNFLEQKWLKSSNTFRLQLGGGVRFVRPVPTCDLASGDVNRTIILPTIKVSDLRYVSSAGAQHFDLTANCSNATQVTFRVTGTPAPGNTLLFANTGTARGIALWMYSRISGVNQTISHNGTRTLAVSGNRAVLPLGVAYYKNGTVSQGTLASVATVNITYN